MNITLDSTEIRVILEALGAFTQATTKTAIHLELSGNSSLSEYVRERIRGLKELQCKLEEELTLIEEKG